MSIKATEAVTLDPTERLTYFIGNANGSGLIRLEIEGTGEHVASMPRGKKSEARAARLVASWNECADRAAKPNA